MSVLTDIPKEPGYTGPFDGGRQNGQTIEKRVREYEGFIDVHSIFHTIQGEGPFCGMPAVFVRLAGCNLCCPFCDTEYTEGRKQMSPTTVLAKVESVSQGSQTGLVVITGGEPFRQPEGLKELIDTLVFAGYFIQVESNGSLAPPKSVLWTKDTSLRQGAYLVCSPKSGIVHPEVWRAACCAKYVGTANDLCDDGLPRQALGHPVKDKLARPPVSFSNPIYLQPVDHQDEIQNKANLDAVVESCMKHGYTIQVQIHKLLGME